MNLKLPSFPSDEGMLPISLQPYKVLGFEISKGRFYQSSIAETHSDVISVSKLSDSGMLPPSGLPSKALRQTMKNMANKLSLAHRSTKLVRFEIEASGIGPTRLLLPPKFLHGL